MLELYFKEGLKHILDIQAYDHMVFLLALVAGFTIRDWRKVLLLVTAFTIGHSITLALSALNVINLPRESIEFFVPLTILATAIYSLTISTEKTKVNWQLYAITLGFGLIHGLAFSNQLKGLLGKTANVFQPLLGFNIGVEIGQIIIVLIILLLSFVLVETIGLKTRILRKAIAIVALLFAIILTIKTWPF